MDILLLNSFHETHIHSFSWGVLSNASYLKYKHNYDVKILDGSYYFNKREEFFNKLDEYINSTKLIGFTCFSTDVYEVKNMIDIIKEKKPSIKIVVCGAHAVLLPEQTCEYKNIDFVCYGDGELALSQLISKINNGETNYNDVIENYKFEQPNSFEEWSDAMINDNLGLNKEIEYPWIEKKYGDLPKFGGILMILYGKTLKELFTIKKFLVIPFVLLVKWRVNNEYYNYMYDMKIFAFVFKKLHMYYK